jgi:hypothetical protein
VVGFYTLDGAKTSIHEVTGMLWWVTSAIFLVGMESSQQLKNKNKLKKRAVKTALL